MATKKKSAENLSDSNFMIVVALISLLVVGATVLIGKSLITDIILNTKIVALKNTANNNMDKNLQAAPKLVQQYDELGQTAKEIQHALPTSEDFPALIAMMENIAAVSGTDLKSVAPSLAVDPDPATASGAASTDGPVVKPFKFSVSMGASYNSLLAFLTAVEKSARPVNINNVQITGSGSNLLVEIDMTTFYQEAAKIPYKMQAVK